MSPSFRTVIKTKEFEESLKQIEPNLLRADEILLAVEWYLARTPRLGIIQKNKVKMIPISEFAIPKPVILYYTEDEQNVYLLSIEESPDFPNNDE